MNLTLLVFVIFSFSPETWGFGDIRPSSDFFNISTFVFDGKCLSFLLNFRPFFSVLRLGSRCFL